jgi:hypothetical protein
MHDMDSFAAKMIKRFRESPPKSRTERLLSKQDGEISQPWYLKSTQKDLIDDDNDRLWNTRSSKKNESKFNYSSDIRNTYKEPHSNLYDNNSWKPSESIEDIIANDIKRLENNLFLSKDNNTKSKKNHKDIFESIDFMDNHFRSSTDTLGNTGFRGLLSTNLKLGADNKENLEPLNHNCAHIQSSMDQLMKSLVGGGLDKVEDNKSNEPGSISEVPFKLEVDLKAFNKYYEQKFAKEDAEDAERKG